MTDSRTNEPTEAQVEAAAKAMIAQNPDYSDANITESEMDWYLRDARAALVAAARAARGAAPSVDIRVLAEVEVRKSAVEGNPVIEPGVTKEIAFVRGAVWGAAQGAAPVLPSSGVDEDKLAEVKARALDEAANDLRVSFSRGAAIAMHHQCHKKQCRCGNPGNDEIVREVFEAAREELRARAAEYRNAVQ